MLKVTLKNKTSKNKHLLWVGVGVGTGAGVGVGPDTSAKFRNIVITLYYECKSNLFSQCFTVFVVLKSSHK